MNWYKRQLYDSFPQRFGKGKAIVLLGPRQVGKTTLIHAIIKDKPHLFLNGDDSEVRGLLKNPNTQQIKDILGQHNLVFIDEAQRIEGIGLTLKIITDQFKQVQLLVSGSSSLFLANNLNEPLTGRKWQYELLPISWHEYKNLHGFLHASQTLEHRLIYGMYPEVLNSQGDEKEVLKDLLDSYLYKDLLAFDGIRKPEILEKLVRALAFQIGSEVNYNELSGLIGVDKNTIIRYIDLLEQGYIVFRLPTYSTNLRTEIKRNKKIYFYDNGVANAVMGDFRPFNTRQNKGNLFENFIISERRKQLKYTKSFTRSYFWRTKQQQEVDYIEEVDGAIKGYEIKWNPSKTIKLPKTFTNHYKVEGQLLNSKNFMPFLDPPLDE